MKKSLRDKVNAELDELVKAIEDIEKEVEALERLMREVVEREQAVAERERQSHILVDDVVKKTAELVLNEEKSLTKRTVGALKLMTDQLTCLCSAIKWKCDL